MGNAHLCTSLGVSDRYPDTGRSKRPLSDVDEARFGASMAGYQRPNCAAAWAHRQGGRIVERVRSHLSIRTDWGRRPVGVNWSPAPLSDEIDEIVEYMRFIGERRADARP